MSKGFTLIEVITAIVLVAIIMIPLALMAIEYVRSIAYADSLTSAQGLARREMAIVNNLNYDTLADDSYMSYNFDVKRQVSPAAEFGSAVKKVLVTVSPHGSAQKLIELAAYSMNVSFGAGGGSRVSSFSASAGSFTLPNVLSGITLQNTSTASSITMIGVVMTLNKNNILSSITMDGVDRYAGSLSLQSAVPTQVSFQNNFAMSSGTAYSGAQGGRFVFNNAFAKNNTVKIIFVFSDGSQSAEYVWKKP